ncbi:phage antirepressor [Gordonia sp. WA4-43]|uniref:phage antirepressor n=1 Tax=Gordonia sp. WA4-43 TaxID=2878678 RepID=UPI001CFB0A0E|nr:BRO family protein [Gordonia sp. WA4-43]UCZ89030.1 phage antirepressor KilAC domain-containing protein [Gordonia sp. WA4-43]
MSADLMPFEYEGRAVRTVVIDGDPWFVAADVAQILRYRMASDMTRRLDDDDRGTRSVRTPSGDQDMTIINEPGLYQAVLGAKSNEARDFKRWVTHTVLPEIRKTGSFNTQPALPDRRALAQMVIEAEDRADREHAARVEAESQAIALAAPASAWKNMASSQGDYMVRDAAKVLSRDPSIEIGQQRLFKFMQGEGWIFRENGSWKPYQTQVQTGRLAEKLNRPYLNEHTGEYEVPAPSIRITPKGLAELHKRLGGTSSISVASAV